MQLQQELESIADQLQSVPESHKSKAQGAIDRCLECLKAVPAVDTPIYIHVTGTDKSFKTSYLLDLFDNDELRRFVSVKLRTTTENTAVPCMVEPSDQVDQLVADQISISTGKALRENLNQKQFNRLYDLSSGADPDDYLIRIRIPADATPMELAVIEYPGIKEGADAMERQKELHLKFQENMMACLVKFPGVLVTCFQHKVAIPPGHPLDAVLKKYGNALKTDFSHHKLPLVLSLQGETAIASYCGNTNVEQDIQSDFQSYKAFDTVIQLVNPSNVEYPVNFYEPGPHVDQWIKGMSRYRDIDEIREHVTLDGGISWSRRLLKDLATTSYIREALNNLFLKPWMLEAKDVLVRARDCHHEISNFDEVKELKERMRQAILTESYQTLRQFFEAELGYAHDGIVTDHQGFWNAVFSQYLGQFIDDADHVRGIADTMWSELAVRLDPDKKGFLGTREKDIPYIIMNMAEFYVPNALMRGEHTQMARKKA
ncbi:MAG: hypothetical protein MI747_09360 [Desulfobacterales bacterium]|nr:hypothetical protein [Desulfobacterales bacterium]